MDAERNHVYYDLQVLDTNNYVDEFGHIHHNSGKTRAGTMRAVALLLSDPGANVGIFLPTYDLLKLRAMPGVEEDLQMLGIPYTINKSEYKIDVPGYGFIIFRSYDNPARIVSFEIAHAIVDEIDTLKKSDAEYAWRKISERVRQKRKRPNSVAVVTTPDQGVNGFVYEKWVKKQQPGYELIKAPTTSNPFLPEGYIDQIRKNYDPILADLYINGEFVSLNDKKVYHFFNRQKHHTSRTIRPDDHLHISIDFNIGGCCATVWVIEDSKPKAVDEFTSHDTQDFVNNLSRYKSHKVYVYPDASGKASRTNASMSDVELIEKAGFYVDCPAMNPAVRDRINAFNALLAHDRIEVNTDKCPNLANALEVQGYTDKGEPEKFNDHPSVDDWNDSAGYFIHRRFPIVGQVVGGLRFGR